MTIGFKIPGKCLLKQSTNVCGMTDESDFITVKERVFKLNVHSNESGPNIPAAVFELGRYCEIRAPLTQFDRSVLDPLMKAQGAATLGQIGTLGAAVDLNPFTILSAITGSTSYTFNKCYFMDSIDVEGWGIVPQKIIVVLWAIADPAALSTATTAYYTTATN